MRGRLGEAQPFPGEDILLRGGGAARRLEDVGGEAEVNRAGTAVSVAPTAYRRDSRVEVFSDTIDWADFEQQLLGFGSAERFVGLRGLS